ncbi:hypothetical protein [Anaerosphaera multitolerans]|uniref:Uncharacterized protein n=1 Tax=Anaerosphaera multitolerans TaxID=2487351 RepID=A0A437S4X6_9FIRM|nr:hypothetical protein [Anaerosphaera multitolerans]RVU54050.1 hypothetical protein EF514_09275 [Anaerosphaera multitolerans]
MKEKFLLRETVKNYIVIMAVYLISYVILSVLSNILLFGNGTNKAYFIKNLQWIFTIVISLFLFYTYFVKVFKVFIGSGYTRKNFITFALLLIISLALSLTFIDRILYEKGNFNNLLINLTVYLNLFLIISIGMTLTGKYEKGNVFLVIVFLNPVAMLLVGAKNIYLAFYLIIDVIFNIFNRESSFINIIGETSIFTGEFTRVAMALNILFIGIYSFWLITSNLNRDVRE